MQGFALKTRMVVTLGQKITAYVTDVEEMKNAVYSTEACFQIESVISGPSIFIFHPSFVQVHLRNRRDLVYPFDCPRL